MSRNNNFTYIFIPSDETKPIEELKGDSSGGLENDYLMNKAKEHFSKNSFDYANASPQEKESILKDVKRQLAQTKTDPNHYTDEALLQMVSSASSTCEILALTIPIEQNEYRGVSMYTAPNNAQYLAYNRRASDILRYCNYKQSEAQTGVNGDVFIGRYHDNEAQDIWNREDFTKQDCLQDSVWCQIASKTPSNHGTMSSLSQLMGNHQLNQQAEKEEDTYKWSQTQEDVEMRFLVEGSIRGKDVQVKFQMKSITVRVSGNILVQNELGGDIVVDESTYTLESAESNKKELCISLSKKSENWWENAIKK